MEEKNKKRQIAKISVFITSIFVIFMSVTYAFINQTLTGTKKVTITAGTLSLVLDEKNEITISDALPMYDQVGMIQEEVFNFDLINNTANDTNYVLKLQKISTTNELAEDDVKYYLTKNGVGTPALLSSLTDGIIDEGTIIGEDTINYTLRLWIRDEVTNKTAIEGKSLSYKLVVEASMLERPTETVLLEWDFNMTDGGEEISDLGAYKITDNYIAPEEFLGAKATYVQTDGTELSFIIVEEMIDNTNNNWTTMGGVLIFVPQDFAVVDNPGGDPPVIVSGSKGIYFVKQAVPLYSYFKVVK